jgi:hypothetical protein
LGLEQPLLLKNAVGCKFWYLLIYSCMPNVPVPYYYPGSIIVLSEILIRVRGRRRETTAGTPHTCRSSAYWLAESRPHTHHHSKTTNGALTLKGQRAHTPRTTSPRTPRDADSCTAPRRPHRPRRGVSPPFANLQVVSKLFSLPPCSCPFVSILPSIRIRSHKSDSAVEERSPHEVA